MNLDDHAAKLLHLVVCPIVDIVHEGDIDEAAKALERYEAPQLREMAIMLAALVDPSVPPEEALAWWTRTPADIVPLHADEWYGDAPPMRLGPSVEALVQERFQLSKKAA